MMTMIVLLIFAFFSGAVTILAPCIWPLLPIILSSSVTGGKAKPLGITLGIISSFAFFTLALSYIVKIVPFDPNILRLFAVVVIGFFGFTLIIPPLNQIIEGWVSRLSSITGPVNKTKGNGFGSGLITGVSLGIVWSPCAGPILATIATLAATQAVNVGIIFVTIAYVVGAGIPLFMFATVGNRLFSRSRILNKFTGRIQQIFGVIMILTAIAIYTNFDKTLQTALLDFIPSYSNFVTRFESNSTVIKQLNILKGNKNIALQKMENKPMRIISNNDLPNLGPVPDFVGITKWLNTDKSLTISDLKGKVVLVDFWTYTCINCIRTLPHVTSWYDNYKNKGFIVIGVHTPEFQFEKDTANVRDAIKRFNIRYPVAQDNNYGTWNNYNNEYWPAEYLIDAQGNLRHTNFGEGDYDQTEQYIRQLLQENGQTVTALLKRIPDQTPHGVISPETYLGSNRQENQATAQPIPLNYFMFSGSWNVQPEYAQAGKGAALLFHFQASHVYLVIRPGKPGDKVKVLIDGKPVSEITLDTERLYDITDYKNVEEHLLRLEFENPGAQCFAFTFG